MSSRGPAKKVRPAGPAASRKAPPPAPKRPAAKVSHLPKAKAPVAPAAAKKPPAAVAAKAGVAPVAARKPTSPPPPEPRPPARSPGQTVPPPVPQAALAPKKPMAPPPRPSLPPKQQSTLVRSCYWSELRVGDDLPPLAKPAIDRVQFASYAVVAGEPNRLHLDEPYAVALGYRGAFAPGTLALGFAAQMLTQWLRRGQVRKLSARFVKIVRPGDELVARGRIAELRREKGACFAEVELWAENQKGELVLRGHASCELPESASSVVGEGGPAHPSGAPPPALPLQRMTLPPPPRPPLRKK